MSGKRAKVHLTDAERLLQSLKTLQSKGALKLYGRLTRAEMTEEDKVTLFRVLKELENTKDSGEFTESGEPVGKKKAVEVADWLAVKYQEDEDFRGVYGAIKLECHRKFLTATKESDGGDMILIEKVGVIPEEVTPQKFIEDDVTQLSVMRLMRSGNALSMANTRKFGELLHEAKSIFARDLNTKTSKWAEFLAKIDTSYATAQRAINLHVLISAYPPMFFITEVTVGQLQLMAPRIMRYINSNPREAVFWSDLLKISAESGQKLRYGFKFEEKAGSASTFAETESGPEEGKMDPAELGMGMDLSQLPAERLQIAIEEHAATEELKKKKKAEADKRRRGRKGKEHVEEIDDV